MVINNGKKPTEGRFIGCTHSSDGSIDITIPASASEEFKQLVRRAINTWPDKSYEIADFADRLLHETFARIQAQEIADNSNGIVEICVLEDKPKP